MHSVSVIIPCHQPHYVAPMLSSLIDAPNSNYINEIILIGANLPETDWPVKIIRPIEPVTAPVARNLGLRSAQSEWIAFIDADCEAKPDWLPLMMGAAESGHLVVGGGVVFGKTGFLADAHNVSMLHEFHFSAPSGPRQFLPTLNLLIHRSVYDRTGEMKADLRRAQDLEWTSRMRAQGIPLWFDASAWVVHSPERMSYRQMWRDYYETGRNSYRVRSQEGNPFPSWLDSSLRLRMLAPFIALASTVRIFIRHPALLCYWPTWPVVWFTKLAWCVGAAHAIQHYP